MSNAEHPFTGPFTQPALVITQHATDVQRIDEMSGGVYRLCGIISLLGYGEALVPANFPIRFIEKPSVSTGGEMGPSSILQNGSYPTISGVVKDWIWNVRDDTGRRFYAGCSFAIVVTGPPEQQLFFHYQMEGHALRNPL